MKRAGRRIPARHRSRRAPPRRPGAKRTSTRKHRQKRNTPGKSWERLGRNWTRPRQNGQRRNRRGQLLRPQSCCLSRCKTKFCRITSFPCFLCTAKGIQHTTRVNAGRAKHMGQPQPAQQRIRGRLRREKAGLPCKAAHRLSSRKCHSRMLPAMPAFRLSTRSVMGMRTVLLQAAMVSSVRP